MARTIEESPTARRLGRIGAPMTAAAMAARRWDVVIVGAGHNGLTCAAYLARAGRSVLVLEARPQVGGACTLVEYWPGHRISPCAYLLGLMHPQVMSDLDLMGRGLRWSPAEAGMFVPFEEGDGVQFWEDDRLFEAEVARIEPKDVAGFRAMSALKSRVRDALRPEGDGDVWLHRPPTREQIEARLGHDPDAIGLLFEWSMIDYVDRFLVDERLKTALLGQGVIGTNASPHDPGTASIHFHHNSGRLGGRPGVWGYVQGGMGMVSFLLCDAAREAGATVATGMPVARICPGQGVELEGGERIAAEVVVCNADPAVAVKLLGEAVDPEWKARVEAIPRRGCTLKLNVALRELPSFKARPGTNEPHHRGQINTPLNRREWLDFHRLAQQGILPPRLWTELYFHTPHDPTIAPPGVHSMSVFAQYVPYEFAEGDWEDHRDAAAQRALDSIARFCDNLPEAIDRVLALGPPDIEREVGLTGGHIFQGECLPPYMWSQRLEARTPMPGVFLCGAATYPGGSVIAVNGRNAAYEILGLW